LSGYGIKNYRHEMPPTPVDYVTQAIVALGEHHAQGQGIFHIAASNQSITDVFERCNEIAGTSLELKPVLGWISEIKRLHEGGRSIPIVPLIESAFAMHEVSNHEREPSSGRTRCDCRRTHSELERIGIKTPVFDDSLLKLCVEGMFSRDGEVQACMASK
jgi:hypothetical protein